ncbi:MAG TPA: hypothetical protein PLQ65_01365 [Flavihumibacter sp.]|nr:hypothetical protein [Flavihumibacter sp.]
MFLGLVFVSCVFRVACFAQATGNAFTDLGVACPVSVHRGTAAAVDENGRDVLLSWLFDHRGGYGLLMIDAETGQSRQFDIPFPVGDAPYASLLSSRNRFYTFFNNYFVEFDPAKPGFVFSKEASPQMAMAFTEDSKGLIWAVTYPNSGLVSYDPSNGNFNDYGFLYQQNWRQYPRSIAVDDSGWVYVGLGNTASQVLAFDPLTKTNQVMLKEEERVRGSAFVYRQQNGEVYANALKGNKEGWFRLLAGKRLPVAGEQVVKELPQVTGDQNLFYGKFKRQGKAVSIDMVEHRLYVERNSGRTDTLHFDYRSEGSLVMGLAAMPDGSIAGGATFPMRLFQYKPRTGEWQHFPAYGQFNTVEVKGKEVYFGVYPQGALLQWNPFNQWNDQEPSTTDANPHLLAASVLHTHRPHSLLITDDEVILSGTPEYGYTGGGLLFWDKKTKKARVLSDSLVLPDQSTMSMGLLNQKQIIAGTTTMPGTGGEKKAKEASLYIMDISKKKILWQSALIAGVQDYSDLCVGDNGLVYGIADLHIFFVFDPRSKKLLYQEDVKDRLGLTAWAQAPRVFIRGAKKGELYVLLAKGIAQVDTKKQRIELLAASPVQIEAGGDFQAGKIYFLSKSHLFSYTLPDSTNK